MIAVVGGGLAGTALAKLLDESNQEFLWIKDNEVSASHISSGIINPVTGRRYVLSWNYETLKNIAIKFYGEYLKPIVIEKHFNPFKEEMTVHEVIEGKEEYLSMKNEEWIHVHNAFQLNTHEFINFYYDNLKAKNKILEEKFDYNLLEEIENNWSYKEYKFSAIIFAEGIFVKENPFFNFLDFIPNRGEAIVLDIEDFELTIVKKIGKFICNYQNKFWVGSSFERVDYQAPKRTKFLYEELVAAIPNLISNKKYKILEHLGAFRSTTSDRRPIIGKHPKYKNLYIFNGFGAKGTSLIPYCTERLIELILHDKELELEISINRLKNP